MNQLPQNRTHESQQGKACVIGAGPNGLAAAIALAQSGFEVRVFEAEPQPGGAARTLDLTLPGFHHDFGSAVHPMAAGSPFFQTLPLADHGLEWIHSPAPLAHPLDDGTAVMLERSFDDAQAALGEDGAAWRSMMEPLASHWNNFTEDILRPPLSIPRHPMLLAKFAQDALASARFVARRHFRNERARALFAGLAAHSFLSLDAAASASFGLVLGAAAHAVGWPIPRGGSQSITNALCRYLETLGGVVHTSSPIETFEQLPPCELTLCDLTPRQLISIAGEKLSPGYRNRLQRYRYGPGVFKVDYALSNPIPWTAPECLRAATVHVGGSMDEIAASEAAVVHGKVADRPFLIVVQPTLFDPTRAPEGKHIAWAYCHVPNGWNEDCLNAIEDQIERFAPGFRDSVLARRVFTPAGLEGMDANLVGGDISGGAMDLRQLVFRPTGLLYQTSASDLYLCSSSTPPGGGVHGMCGYNAAQVALRRMK
ncbi:FAD-dependent oxidoreductase [Edaphobacter acidisoli]|uniref:FAD-dependent oxidoreductase n=1 Tax=Edaphobacter acidisoli TaxID=2040573 RepID=A0A916VYP8_9BACT|nr:NAD(P)/FAD-dependent oxidoreductase [Edaphobacter acidisoli]GGA53451.1 FAD-dependent oxidoreductase [Edaphobacter acidisoli]